MMVGRAAPVSSEFAVGKNLAITPGRVVFRNQLIELIQYDPATPSVYPEPVLIVPAWIMKYYILDLQPKNSLIKFLVDHGHTVFAISWKNPTDEHRDLGMDEYRRSGVMAAFDVIERLMPNRKVHACGYCLGGTMLSIAAAAMAREGDDRIASMTLFAAQMDFAEPGELKLYINDTSLSWLDGLMATRGYLDGSRMGGAFQMLRANDLLLGPFVRRYVLGETDHPNDLMTWNADQTRMPYRSAQQEPKISAAGVDLDAGPRGLNGLCVRSTPGKQRNRAAAPMDVFRHVLQALLYRLARIIKPLVFDQDLHARIQDIRVTRTRRLGGVEGPIRALRIAAAVPDPGQLNHCGGIVGMAANNF